MITNFRAWHKKFKVMKKVGQITFTEAVWDYQPEQQNDTVGVSIPYQPDYVLMQSTGLHDKNGKEIYEGDIVKFVTEYDGNNQPPRNIKYEIVTEKAVTIIKNNNNRLVLNMINNEIEVVGNIHGHKYLLENQS